MSLQEKLLQSEQIIEELQLIKKSLETDLDKSCSIGINTDYLNYIVNPHNYNLANVKQNINVDSDNKFKNCNMANFGSVSERSHMPSERPSERPSDKTSERHSERHSSSESRVSKPALKTSEKAPNVQEKDSTTTHDLGRSKVSEHLSSSDNKTNTNDIKRSNAPRNFSESQNRSIKNMSVRNQINFFSENENENMLPISKMSSVSETQKHNMYDMSISENTDNLMTHILPFAITISNSGSSERQSGNIKSTENSAKKYKFNI